MNFSFTKAGVLFKMLGRLRLRLGKFMLCSFVIHVVFVCCECRCLHLVSAANFAGPMTIDCASTYNKTWVLVILVNP